MDEWDQWGNKSAFLTSHAFMIGGQTEFKLYTVVSPLSDFLWTQYYYLKFWEYLIKGF